MPLLVVPFKSLCFSKIKKKKAETCDKLTVRTCFLKFLKNFLNVPNFKKSLNL